MIAKDIPPDLLARAVATFPFDKLVKVEGNGTTHILPMSELRALYWRLCLEK